MGGFHRKILFLIYIKMNQSSLVYLRSFHEIYQLFLFRDHLKKNINIGIYLRSTDFPHSKASYKKYHFKNFPQIVICYFWYPIHSFIQESQNSTSDFYEESFQDINMDTILVILEHNKWIDVKQIHLRKNNAKNHNNGIFLFVKFPKYTPFIFSSMQFLITYYYRASFYH